MALPKEAAFLSRSLRQGFRDLRMRNATTERLNLLQKPFYDQTILKTSRFSESLP
jgi:hypothetical protein